jgi:cobalt-zinc-cadmium efflux system outer membrane protein
MMWTISGRWRTGLWPAVALAVVTQVQAAEPSRWTLEASLRRAVEVAPEQREAEAQVAARAAERTEAGAWPNPSVELRADEKLGIDDGRGGTDLTYAGISQPLPLLRLARQRRAADNAFGAARDNLRYQQLLLEHRTAVAYHRLQLAHAHSELAVRHREQMLELASGRGRDPLVRYLSASERLRLNLLLDEASQAAASAEGELSEARSRFTALLALPADAESAVTELAPLTAPRPLAEIERGLDAHPAVSSARGEEQAARAQIDAARSRRFADPALILFRERDYLGGERRAYNGVGLNVQVPLWNLNRGPEARITAEADGAHARRAARERDLAARLRQSHLHVGHLIEQAEHQRERVLVPSERLFELSRRSFAAGEVNVLALVDAHDSYLAARLRYLELLTQQWLEAAELRLAAGESLLAAEVTP